MNALSLTNKKVLVIGASGQIGTELLKQLKAESCKITALRRSKWDKVKKRSSINYLSSDIKDYDSDILKKLILENDYIFHLAGDVDVQSSPEEESEYFFSWITPLQGILSSIVGSRGFDELSAYGSSKGALDAFTRCIAIEFSKQVKINNVCPGFTKTSYFKKFKRKKKLYNWTIKNIPVGRWANSEEIANLILYLISDKSSYVTGQNFYIDGGWTSK